MLNTDKMFGLVSLIKNQDMFLHATLWKGIMRISLYNK